VKSGLVVPSSLRALWRALDRVISENAYIFRSRIRILTMRVQQGRNSPACRMAGDQEGVAGPRWVFIQELPKTLCHWSDHLARYREEALVAEVASIVLYAASEMC